MRLCILASASTIVLASSLLVACAAPLDPDAPPAKHDSGTSRDSGVGETSIPGADTGSPYDSGATYDSVSGPDSSVAFDSGVDTGRSDPFDVGVDDATDPCTACMDSSCASEESACTSDPTCTETIDCIDTCGDETCADGCVTTYHSSTFEPFLTCLETTCASACGGPPPDEDAGPPPPFDAGDAGDDDATDPCDACIDADCGSEMSTCETDATCTALMDCLSTCLDPTCADTCMSTDPSPAYDALDTCVETNCRTACGGPSRGARGRVRSLGVRMSNVERLVGARP